MLDQTVLGWLLTRLPSATSLRVASAYYDGRILNWLEQPIEELIRRGGEAHFVIGSNQGLTRREDLDRLLKVIRVGRTRASLRVEYYEDAIFHPKVYVVETAQETAALVGSANFTANGSILNIEAGIELVGTGSSRSKPPLTDIIASLDSRRTGARVRTATDLDKLVSLGVIGRPRPTPPPAQPSKTSKQRKQRATAGLGQAGVVGGVPAPTRRPKAPPPVHRPRRRRTAPVPTAAGVVALPFAQNDLKNNGTSEMSVSKSIRGWAANISGGQIVAGDDTLFYVNIEARLAASPNRVWSTPEPVRIWATGGKGSTTHFDVRLVLGNSLKDDLDNESVRVTGRKLASGDIGVFELPVNPAGSPVRLTVFTTTDPSFATLKRRLARPSGGTKPELATNALALIPRWPY